MINSAKHLTVWKSASLPAIFLLTLVFYSVAQILANVPFTLLLDDPYIHMSLAKTIATTGSYGINPGEFSSPSSSILWPILIAPLTLLPNADAWLAACNVAMGCLVLGLVSKTILDLTGHRPGAEILASLVAGAMVIALNLVYLTLSGMEHVLQVLLTVLLIERLFAEYRTATFSVWLGVALVLGPLVRYENLVLSSAAILYLAMFRRHWGPSFASATLITLAIGGFTVFLRTIDQGWVPASITAKAITDQNLSLWDKVLSGLATKAFTFTSVFTAVVAVFIAKSAWDQRSAEPAKAGWGAMIVGVVALNLAFGGAFYWGRYEVYLVPLVVLTALWIRPQTLDRLLQHTPAQLATKTASITVIAFAPFVFCTIKVPEASINIYSQQGQMARFVRDFYKAPTAINDLGLVAYYGDQKILDLWGLASVEAQSLRREADIHPDWMDTITRRENVGLAMIFDEWFQPNIPVQWKKVAVLKLKDSVTEMTVAGRDVALYCTSVGDCSLIRKQLEDFALTLPVHAELAIMYNTEPG